MPIEPCTNKEGKHGYRWGGPTAPCQVGSTPEESKKQAIRVGLKVAGPKKFSKIMKHEKGWTSEDRVLAAEILQEENEKNKGWYGSFTTKEIADFARKSVKDSEQVDQFGNKKKKNPPVDVPNDHYETSYTTQADQVETLETKQSHMQDLEDENKVKTKDSNAQQVFNLRDKQRQDEEDGINVKNPTT